MPNLVFEKVYTKTLYSLVLAHSTCADIRAGGLPFVVGDTRTCVYTLTALFFPSNKKSKKASKAKATGLFFAEDGALRAAAMQVR